MVGVGSVVHVVGVVGVRVTVGIGVNVVDAACDDGGVGVGFAVVAGTIVDYVACVVVGVCVCVHLWRC